MDTASGTDKLAGFLNDQGSFVFSIVVGMIVIAFYARRRIQELTNPPKGEEYAFIRSLPMDAIVGESNFNKAYVIYVLMLEFFYFFICTSKPLVFVIAGDTAGAAFNGAAWPLGAALLVVGLLPSTPIVAQIETMLRSLAQRIANIPGEFFNRVSRLSRKDVEKYLGRVSDYTPEYKKYKRINNLLLFLGQPPNEARLAAKSCISTDLFMQWTISRGSTIWSAGEYAAYKDIITDLKPRVEELLANVDKLIAETLGFSGVEQTMNALGVKDPSRKIEPDKAESILGEVEKILSNSDAATISKYDDLNKKWENIVSECDFAARKLCTLFVIIARNDKEANRRLTMSDGDSRKAGDPRPDSVLRAVLSLMNTTTGEPDWWSEAAVIAALVAFTVCTLSLSIYIFLVDLATGCCTPRIDPSVAPIISPHPAAAQLYHLPSRLTEFQANLLMLSGDVKAALLFSSSFGLSFVSASVVALFLRSLKREEHSWSTFNTFPTFRPSNYLGIVGWSSMAAFMPLVVSYVLAYYTSKEGMEQISQLKASQLLYSLFFQYLFGLTAVAYGVAACLIADILHDETEDLTVHQIYKARIEERKAEADAADAATAAGSKNQRDRENEENREKAEIKNELRKARAQKARQTTVIATLLITFVSFIVLVANPAFAMTNRSFWTNLFAVFVFVSSGLAVFTISFRAFQERDDIRKMAQTPYD